MPSTSLNAIELTWNDLTLDKKCELPGVITCTSLRVDSELSAKISGRGAGNDASCGQANDASQQRWTLRQKKPNRLTILNFEGKQGNPGLRFKMEPETFNVDSLMRLDTVSGQIAYPGGFYGHVMDAWRSSDAQSHARQQPRSDDAAGAGGGPAVADNARRESKLLDIVDSLRHERRLMHSEIETLKKQVYVAEERFSKKEKASLFNPGMNASSSRVGQAASNAVCIPMDFDQDDVALASKLGTPSKSFKPLTALARPLFNVLPQRIVAISVIPLLRTMDSFSCELLHRPVLRATVFSYLVACTLVLVAVACTSVSSMLVDGPGENTRRMKKFLMSLDHLIL